MIPDMYWLFKLEFLHKLYLCIQKTLSEITIAYLSSDTILTNLIQTWNKQKPLIQLPNVVFHESLPIFQQLKRMAKTPD